MDGENKRGISDQEADNEIFGGDTDLTNNKKMKGMELAPESKQ